MPEFKSIDGEWVPVGKPLVEVLKDVKPEVKIDLDKPEKEVKRRIRIANRKQSN